MFLFSEISYMYAVYLSHIYLSLPQSSSSQNLPIKYMPFYNYVF